MDRQATLNVGIVGHVSHGKTTLVRALTGINTVRYKSEMERNITIKLGYANVKIWRCECGYRTTQSTIFDVKCESCGQEMFLMKHISFVDCPGHEVLMSTMINGSAIMDAAILLIDASQSCPQPQTIEHLIALEIAGVKKIIIVQNKIDLVTQQRATESYNEIRSFIRSTIAENSPIVPISAQLRVNIDYVVKWLTHLTLSSPNDGHSYMNIVRSFDVNKPGTLPPDLKGGVIGGRIISGEFKVGDTITIVPGIFNKDTKTFTHVTTLIVSLNSETNELESAGCGGLIGVGTTIDSSLCKADGMIGQIAALDTSLITQTDTLRVRCKLLKRYVTEGTKINDISINESIMIHIACGNIVGKCTSIVDGVYTFTTPYKSICYLPTITRATLSRCVDRKWRLIGWGDIERGNDDVITPTAIDIPAKKKRKFDSYDDMLASFYYASIPEINTKINIGRMNIVPDGKKRTKCTNFTDVCQRIHRDVDSVAKFISTEFGGESSIDSTGALIIRGRFNVSSFENALKRYIVKFCICKACRSINTTVQKINRLNVVCCDGCNSQSTITA